MKTLKEKIIENYNKTEPDKRIEYEFVEKKGYGFEKEKPIILFNVEVFYTLMNRLRLKEYPRSRLKNFNRLQSLTVPNIKGRVDHVEIMFQPHQPKEKIIVYDLYFCCYPQTNVSDADILMFSIYDALLPEGFVLFDLRLLFDS